MDRTEEQLRRAEAYALANNPRRAWEAFTALTLSEITAAHWNVVREVRTVLLIAEPEELDYYNKDGLLIGRMITAYVMGDDFYRRRLLDSARELESYRDSYKGLANAMQATAEQFDAAKRTA